MKKYSLALGGGAARGLAHVGVIKCLEEKEEIQINEISGTSMGAIIASCYAIGMTSGEMIDFTRSVNFLRLLDFNMKHGIVQGAKVMKKFEEIFGDKKIEDCSIPLKIIATDIESGVSKTFTKGSILDAVRASISLPSIFSPYEINGIKYVDGGLKHNLPVHCLDGNNIIAVSAVREKPSKLSEKRTLLNMSFKKGFFALNYQILKKTIGVIMASNEDSNIEIARLKGKNITLICPKVGDFEYYDFNKVEKLAILGYNQTKEILEKSK